MAHLHMTYEEVMRTPIIHVNLLVSESSPRYDKDDDEDDEVTLDTYYGEVKAKKKFII